MARTAGRHTRKSRMQNSRKAKEKLKNFSRGGLVRHGIKDKPITARRLEHDNFNFLSAYARSCKRSRSASQLSVIFQIDSILRGRIHEKSCSTCVQEKSSFVSQTKRCGGWSGRGRCQPTTYQFGCPEWPSEAHERRHRHSDVPQRLGRSRSRFVDTVRRTWWRHKSRAIPH